jgi:FAD/FMN-containing dehydrogenase
MFNQTPFLTKDQAQKAFGGRLKLFADYRRQADPDNRLLDSYFRDFLS